MVYTVATAEMLEGTAGRAQELKAQGVLEAAADPNSSITVDQAEHAAADHARAGGAAVFEFDPDASPEEKAAQAKDVSVSAVKEHHMLWLLLTARAASGPYNT